MPGFEPARDALAKLGIRSARDCALWARRHGLLSVYIEYRAKPNDSRSPIYPAHWRIVRPDYKTDTDAPAWARGCKVFRVETIGEKRDAEWAAREWAYEQYNVRDWLRIEGLGGVLFPDSVAQELRRYIPFIVAIKQRQRYRKQLTHDN